MVGTYRRVRVSPAMKSAFTLIELLVVIAIIAILISLLLPAINSAREAARRVQCINKAKQIATAVIAYESAFGRLPASGQVGENDDPGIDFGKYDPKTGKMTSWMVSILPYIEEEALYQQFDPALNILDLPYQPQAQHVTTYLCPSDSASNRYYEHPELTNSVRFAKGNYAAFVSPFHIDLQVRYPGALGGGRWAADGSKRLGQTLRKVKDGLAKTLMISEVRTRNHLQDQRGVWALPWAGSSQLAFDVHHYPLSGRPYEPWEYTIAGAQLPNNRGFNVDMLYDCPDIENAQFENMPCAEWSDGGSNYYLSAAPRSQHPGGVVAAGMDGHVRFLPDDIDDVLMALLISINDGQNSKIEELTR